MPIQKAALLATILLSSLALQSQQIMVFSKTNGYRHQSISEGQKALKQLAKKHQWQVQFTEDSLMFRDEILQNLDLVIFLQTSGDILNEDQQMAFENFIHHGGAYVGIHGASATEYEWEWYGRLVGNVFDNHPRPQMAKVKCENSAYFALAGLPEEWETFDEWYNFRHPFDSALNILLTVDETSYSGGTHGANHPIAWCHKAGDGRSFYTALGHTSGAFRDSIYLIHLTQGITWALTGNANQDE